MSEEQMAEALAVSLDASGCPTAGDVMAELTEWQAEDLASLVLLAGHLDNRMQLRQAPSVFARSLRQELVREAERRIAARQRRRRIALIGGAVAGGVVSVASLVGGIIVLVRWLRTRTEARPMSAA